MGFIPMEHRNRLKKHDALEVTMEKIMQKKTFSYHSRSGHKQRAAMAQLPELLAVVLVTEQSPFFLKVPVC